MTFGEKCAEAVRDYLQRNGIKQSQLTGALLAELIDRVKKQEDEAGKRKKQLATEENWLREIEADPALAGVNVRKELAKAQFWCRHNNRACTRRFFVNWVNKAERIVSPGGNSSVLPLDVNQEPPGWKESEKARTKLGISLDAWENVIREGWFALDTYYRSRILSAL